MHIRHHTILTGGLLAGLVTISSAFAGDTDPASVTAIPRERILPISQQIDAFVDGRLAEAGQKPHQRIADETFLRRVYLDIVGRIPTLEESRTFLARRDADRRADLIDELLDSPGYASHQYNVWADILRLKTRLNGGNPGRPYIDFVKSALAANMPYDEFVRQMIAAEGPILERGNGAAGYYLRDQGMPEDNMANTVRVFLGTRLECAQCHDHPFDTWTQREFFEMVAFAGGTQTRGVPGSMNKGSELRRELREAEADAKVKQVATQLVRPLSYGVYGGGTGLARLPDSYQYDDGQPNEIVTAKTLFDHQELVKPVVPARNAKRKPRNKRLAKRIPGAKDIGSRGVLADWLTAEDNPRFTLVIANRLWKQAMGLGLIEPIDDLTEESLSSHPELLTYLTQQMVDLDYDMKQFLRAIYNSTAYQRASTPEVPADPGEYLFPGPVMRRMSAEQLWDSFLTLAVPELDVRRNPRDAMPRYGVGKDIYESFEMVKDMSVEDILALAERQLELRENPEQRRKKFRDAMMRQEETNPYAGEAARLRKQVAALKQAQKRMKRQRNPLAYRKLQTKINELSAMLRHTPTRVGADLVRASELPSPTPPGHFLREFGQSDRDQIENANTEPAVSQVLSLMNGQIEKRIISNPRTVLMRNVVLAQGVDDKIETIFLSMLSRTPSRAEQKQWRGIAKEDGATAANDLIWTLANTTEFMFIY